MLQQTQVKAVVPYWERWMRALPDIASLAKVKPERIHKLWEGLGYYTRVRNMQKAAKIIQQRHGSEFPSRFEDVLALPGVGRYTAGAICSIAFDQATPILDGNVMRVLTRVFGIGGNPRAAKINARLWQVAAELVQTAARSGQRSKPASDASRPCSDLNQSLMELGAVVCTPRQPRCGVCPVAKLCVALREDRVDEFPGRERRVRATPRRFIAFVAQSRGRFLVRQRPAGVVNAHLWEFPNVEAVSRETNPLPAARDALGFAPTDLTPLCTIKHSITRYRITLEVFQVGLDHTRRPTPSKGQWLTPARMRQLPFTGAHRRILQGLDRGLLRFVAGARPSGRFATESD